MKVFTNYYKQIFFILIAFLLLDITAVQANVLSFAKQDAASNIYLWVAFAACLPLFWGISRLLSGSSMRKLWLWSGLIYVIYTSFSYLLQVTRHVNDSSFKAENLSSNHFWQSTALPYVFLILLLVTCVKYVPLWSNFSFFKKITKDKEGTEFFENLFLSQLLIFMSLLDSKMIEVLQHSPLLANYFKEKTVKISHDFVGELMNLLLYIFLFALIPSFLAVKGVKDLSRNKASLSVATLFSAAFALIFNYTIQNSIRADVTVLNLRLFTGASLFQILIFFAAFLLVYLIFNRFLLPTLIILTVGIVSSIASSLKFQLRKEPVLPSDIAWLKNSKTLFDFVGGNYGLYFILILLIIGGLYWYCRKKIVPGRLLPNYKYQLALLLLPILFFTGVLEVFSAKKNGRVADNIPVISILSNYHDLTWFGNTVNSQLRSLSFVWFSQLSDKAMVAPKGYSKEKIQELEEKYKEVAEKLNNDRQNKIEEQTVIYVLSESFSDPARVEGVSMSQNPIPNIQAIKEQTTSGLMKSDGYGGGTANMEFQTLTGLPFYNLAPSISVIYTEVVPGMNRFPSISDAYQPKNRTVIHLATPSNYSRNIIYGDLKFDKFIHYGTKGLKGTHIGGNYSDKTTYDQVLDNIKTNQNQFFSVMTMQNHMPWSEPNPTYITANYPGFSDANNKSLSSYVRMLYQTDLSTKDFLEQLSQIDKKITVVFYGDHLPSIYPDSAFKENPESQYLTDYFIWSNFETEKLNYPVVNSSDFTPLLLEQTDSKVSPYQALLTEVLHKASVDKKDLDQAGQITAQDMKMIEYDIVAGKGYLTDDFFQVQN